MSRIIFIPNTEIPNPVTICSIDFGAHNFSLCIEIRSKTDITKHIPRYWNRVSITDKKGAWVGVAELNKLTEFLDSILDPFLRYVDEFVLEDQLDKVNKNCAKLQQHTKTYLLLRMQDRFLRNEFIIEDQPSKSKYNYNGCPSGLTKYQRKTQWSMKFVTDLMKSRFHPLLAMLENKGKKDDLLDTFIIIETHMKKRYFGGIAEFRSGVKGKKGTKKAVKVDENGNPVKKKWNPFAHRRFWKKSK